MKLLSVLKNKPFCNDFHFILVGLILGIISIKYNYVFILLCIYLLFIYKKIKYLIIPIIIFCILFFIFYVYLSVDKEYQEEIEDIFVVVEIKERYYIFEGDYDLLIYRNDENINVGDKIRAKVHLYDWDLQSYENEFNFKEYYKSRNIDYRGYIKDYKFIENINSIEVIKYKILTFYEERLDSKSFLYFKALVLGINDIEEEVKNAYSTLFISHILAISGMHLIFIYNIILKISRHFLKIEGNLFSIIIITLYLILIGFPIAGLRAYLFILLGYLNEKGNIKYTKLDIYSISFIAMSLINPLACYQNSFILSYLVSFLLIFSNEIIKVNSKLAKNFIISILSILITLPFIINMMNSISILNILISPFLSIIVSGFIMPLSFSLVLLPFLPVDFIFIFLDNYLLNLANICKSFIFPSFNFLEILFYYLIFFWLLFFFNNRKRRLLITIYLLFIVFVYGLNTINPYYKITFIDVGQGDSTLIELPYRKGVILIDSFNNVDYLKSIGINKIDIIILTHNDIDHIESIEEVRNVFKVDKIYTSLYEDSLGFNTISIKEGYIIDYAGLKIKVLAPINKYEDANSNSIVIQFNIYNYSFLFMGDASIKTEKDIINKYSSLESDVFKVGHHGSNTSSGSIFIDYVKPKISIISVGKNNKYGLPDSNVLAKLNRYGLVYETSKRGNIEIIVKKNNLEVLSYR